METTDKKADEEKKENEKQADLSSENSLKLGIMLSGGKDSLYAAYLMKKKGNELSCALTMKSKNLSSYMFHTPNISMTKLQSEAMGIPFIEKETIGEKEKELEDLHSLIEKAKYTYGLHGIITGAIFSDYQRERIEKICKQLELEVYSPLWHMNQEEEMRNVINAGFEIILSSIACYGLGKNWLGKIITHNDINQLVNLNNKCGINIAGEGGEFESLVLDCPLFKKKIQIEEKEIISEDENTANLVIKKAILTNK